MANFKIGDTVFLTEEAINYCTDLLDRLPYQWCMQFKESRDRSLIIAGISEAGVYIACPGDKTWGTDQECNLNGKPVKTWKVLITEIEKRNASNNKISLYELNRGF